MTDPAARTVPLVDSQGNQITSLFSSFVMPVMPDITKAQIPVIIGVIAKFASAFGIYTITQSQQNELTMVLGGGVGLAIADAVIRFGRSLMHRDAAAIAAHSAISSAAIIVPPDVAETVPPPVTVFDQATAPVEPLPAPFTPAPSPSEPTAAEMKATLADPALDSPTFASPDLLASDHTHLGDVPPAPLVPPIVG